jgi:hypothetical protein
MLTTGVTGRRLTAAERAIHHGAFGHTILRSALAAVG